MSANATARVRAEAVFQARGLTKVYRMGEVELHALRSVDLDLYEGGCWCCSAPRGRGSQRS